MNRLCAVLLLIVAIVATPPAGTAQDIVIGGKDITPETIKEGVSEKGVDWLKDKAKDAGKDWIFETGQSPTMREILDAALKRANGEGNDKRPLCQGAVMGKASSILTNLNYKTNVQLGGKLALETGAKMISLASGFGAAAGEGGAINWLIGQYADAAKDQAKDSAFDAIKKLFTDEKKPQFELFEAEGKDGKCDYKLRAVWDIVHGTYRVFISGDCHCEMVGNVGVAPQRLGKWWISFEGRVKVTVDATKKPKAIKWVVLDVKKMDFDAQCDCSKRELKKPFEEKQAACPAPGKGLTAEERANIQSEIDAKTAARKEIADKLRDTAGDVQAAESALAYDKAHPKSSPEAQKQELEKDQKRIDAAKAKEYELQAEDAKLLKEINDLKKRLASSGGGASPPAKSSSGVSYEGDPFAMRILNVHNAERAAFGAQPLEWSPALAANARGHAEEMARTGRLAHASRAGRGDERENVNQGMIGWNTDRMMANWLRERTNFVPGAFPNVSRTGRWDDVGHFSQIIWPTTEEVGCGLAAGNGFQWLVCRYSPGGNRDGKTVGVPPPPELVAVEPC